MRQALCPPKKHIGAFSSSELISIDQWVADSLSSTSSELLLQMDIEGAEYHSMLAVSDATMRRFRIIIIIIEVHHLEDLWLRPYFRAATEFFRKILHTHRCVHIHPNNLCGAASYAGLVIPSAMEFTFVRSDRIASVRYRTDFPHALDADNGEGESLSLPECWYGGPNRAR